jgi:hypothetical protein
MAAGVVYTTLDAFAARPTVAQNVIADFRRFAAEQGVSIPAGADVDARLERAIVLWVALAKWNDPGFYRLAALQSADVRRAVEAFARAEDILK